MVDLLLKLFEYLIKHSEIREKNRDKYIERYVDPIYEHAEAIYCDYSKLLRELKKKLQRAKKVGSLLRYLEERHMENFTVRTKTRALLRKRMERHAITRFERGIWGLMFGSVSFFDYGYTSFGPMDDDIMPEHTVLDLMERLICQGKSNINSDDRRLSLDFIQSQIRGIDAAWREVVAGYAELKNETIPENNIPTKYRYKYEGD